MQLLTVIPAMQILAHKKISNAWLQLTMADACVGSVAQQLRVDLHLSISQFRSLLPAMSYAAVILIEAIECRVELTLTDVCRVAPYPAVDSDLCGNCVN